MGTRNITRVIQNGKMVVSQYGQWDGYPTGQLKTIVDFVRNKEKLAHMTNNLGKVVPAENNILPDDVFCKIANAVEYAEYFAENGKMIVHENFSEPWKVTLVDTGLNTMTGGRVRRIKKYVGDEPFFLTYGDGVSDVDIGKLLEFHKSHGKTATLTAIRISQRFGVLDIGDNGNIEAFREKTRQDGGVINGGFMVLEPGIFDLIEGDSTVFEKYPLEECARRGELMAYMHDGFWQCMDTLRDKNKLESLWESGEAPWKVWEG